MSLFNNIKWSPEMYSEAACIAREAGEEMLARLDWMTIKPAMILDVGCGTGEMSGRLQQRYPEAVVLAIDADEGMLSAVTGVACKQALANDLPCENHSVDLIFANFLLPWVDDYQSLFKEWRRVLRPDGVLMLTALGPDTLREWRGQMNHHDIPFFMDMHDLGDGLLQAGFVEPVLDVNHIAAVYKDPARFQQELRASGMWFPSHDENSQFEAVAGEWPAVYEVITAHAFSPVESAGYKASSDGVVRIPLSSLQRR